MKERDAILGKFSTHGPTIKLVEPKVIPRNAINPSCTQHRRYISKINDIHKTESQRNEGKR